MSAGALSGRVIVITRPREHAAGLVGEIRASGGEPLLFPAIEILPPEDSGALADRVSGLERFQLAIFISQTAATRGHALVTASRPWPDKLRVAAVGAGTAALLERLGFEAVIAPSGRADSEALAARPELRDLRGKSVVIFRGQGGREWLRTALEARGAHVEYVECYRRRRPRADAGPLLERWRRGGIDAVSVTSAEGLANFADMLGAAGAEFLRATPVFVPHPRVAEAAAGLGVREIVVTGSGDSHIVAEMAVFFAKV